MNRQFNTRQRRALFIAQDGKCAICGQSLPDNWHADHVVPWSKGGKTDVINGQALCPKCNLTKGAEVMDWRRWQERCFQDWKAKDLRNYLIAATPGSGKSAMAMRIAKYAMDIGTIDRIVCVVPTEYLKFQWKDKAHYFGLELDPYGKNCPETSDYQGMVTTYQAVAVSTSQQHRIGTDRKRTFVIFDEIHHAGDGAWGQSLKYAFEFAEYRLSLSGTPFRSDESFIPFVAYEQDETGLMRSKADFNYGYGEALSDNVLKSIDFIRIDGKASWTFNGTDYESKLSETTKDQSVISQRLRSALHIDAYGMSDWYAEALPRASEKLDELRRDVRPDSAGIIFVEDQNRARAFENSPKIREILGETPIVVYSDKPESKALIDRFRDSTSKWIVSVKQVSEGVDIPRLAVFVYATVEKTDLIFRQRIARVLRIEKKYPENVEAYGYIPDDEQIKALAREIERERDHVIESEDYATSDRHIDGEKNLFEFIPGETYEVETTGVISGSKIFEASPTEAREIAAQSGVSIEVVIKVLHAYQGKQRHEPSSAIQARSEKAVADRTIEMKQFENRLTGKLAKRIAGQDKNRIGDEKKRINTELYKLSGKSKDQCTLEELMLRQDALKGWIRDGFSG